MKFLIFHFLMGFLLFSCATTNKIERIKEELIPVPARSFEEKHTDIKDGYFYALPVIPYFNRLEISNRIEIFSYGYELGSVKNDGFNFQHSLLLPGKNIISGISDNEKFKNTESVPRLDAYFNASYPILKFKNTKKSERPIIFRSTTTEAHYIIPEIEFNRSIRLRAGIDYDFQEKTSRKFISDIHSIKYHQTNLALSAGLSFTKTSNYRYRITDMQSQIFAGRRSTFQEFYADMKLGLTKKVVPIERPYYDYNLNTSTTQVIDPADTLAYNNLGFEFGYRYHFSIGNKATLMVSPAFGLPVGYGDSFINNCYFFLKYSIGFIHYNTKLISTE